MKLYSRLWIGLLSGLFIIVGKSWANPIFPTRLLNNSVAGLTVSVAGTTSWRPFPYYTPSLGEALIIEFDFLGGELVPFSYTLKHYTAQWENSGLAPSEYIKGFISGEITESKLSEATKVSYRHYSLRLDNSAPSQPILSGNYILQIFPANESAENPYLEVAFSLLEPIASIESTVTPITQKESYGGTQQVNLLLKTKELRVTNPIQELTIVVGQNSRHDNAVYLSQPSGITGGQLRYDYNQGALFAAGNEYYAYEILNDNISGMGIDRLVSTSNATQLLLYPQSQRSQTSYLFNQDADGQYVIRSIETGGTSDVNTDYYEVFFYYYAPPLHNNEQLYLFGEAFDALPMEERKLTYDANLGAYTGQVFLKGGYVSFTYLSSSDNLSFSGEQTEGNFYPTSNLYTSFVYYRPQGARYDRLVGVDTIRYNHQQ
ncbi:type IX secretion system plug protein [Porphyromonas circumdentaria]|uniref:Type 9 secretion system plug protein N-terminal domain-containing protein n=1 Tax=Porphyromonas circumdentaria TaxID=29524 RepID=A0A1T4N777_9PORP|nr:type IX secretion system plug protein domain-containing protein [Porphyromonas circumdentaria]MBB6276058.1 hypothetical protein [Porphyromonas circumdentaria]SJZ75031.1 protein of unknown function [Porphyromonas circumdentaria]